MRAVRTEYLVIGLVLLSFAVRIPFTHEFHLEGTGRDSASYIKLAQNFVSGEGWVNYSVHFLFALPESLPHPDSYWSPLFPFLIAIVFAIFGVSFPVAQIVPMTFGVLVPAMVFLLAWELTRSRVAALVAGIIAVFHPTLVLWSSRVQPEIVSIFFVTLTLYLVLRKETRFKPVLVGASLALAYLAKYQNGALVIAVVAYYLFHDFRSRGWKQLLLTGAVSVAVTSPWLIRNTVVFGKPFYSAVQAGLISCYPEFGGAPRLVRSLEPPPAVAGYIVTHLRDTLTVIRGSFFSLVLPFLKYQTGSLWLAPLALLGLCSVPVTWKRGAPVILFSAFLLAFLCVTVPVDRYSFVLIPVWIVLAAVGVMWFTDPPPRLARLGGKPAQIALAAVLLLAVTGEVRGTLNIVYDRDRVWTPGANFGMLEAGAVAGYIREQTGKTEPVLVAQSYHYALVLDRYSIDIPFHEEGVRYLGQRYGVRYAVMSLRDLRRLLPAWETETPDWIELVHRIPAEDIPRPPHHPQYRHVSEMRVYRLK
jgi:4-amino-4-deoxy-L-arabinose transferase-like glycosyltransferase